MAASIPQGLKTADITRFATRAAQVEKAKPAIAYWCMNNAFQGLPKLMHDR